jgi:uncharacterized membrane protein
MKTGRILFHSFLVTAASVALLLPASVLAQEETIELQATYPKVESYAPEPVFRFTVTLIYRGDQVREFNLQTSGPPGWNTYVTSSDESARISVIKLEPDKSEPYQVKVIASPLPAAIVEANNYSVTLTASSGTISDSIELTAVVVPTYSLALFLTGSLYNGEVTAGEDNLFTVTAENTGSGELTDIKFSARKPKDWLVEFQPDEIDRLAPDSIQEVEVNIRPAADATDGYYSVTLIAEAAQARQTTEVRVRIEEPELTWLWVGVAIALLVIGAFAFVFLRLSRQAS